MNLIILCKPESFFFYTIVLIQFSIKSCLKPTSHLHGLPTCLTNMQVYCLHSLSRFLHNSTKTKRKESMSSNTCLPILSMYTTCTSSRVSICWLLSGSEPDRYIIANRLMHMNWYTVCMLAGRQLSVLLFEARWNCEGVDG